MRAAIVICLLLASLAAPCAAVQAQAHILLETKETQTSNGKPAAALLINGTVVIRLAKPQSGRTPLRSVSSAATRLAAAFRSGKYELSAKAAAEKEQGWALLLNGGQFLYATDLEAKAWGVEPEALAKSWQQNIGKALHQTASEPGTPVKLPAPVAGGLPTAVTMPPGTGIAQQGGGVNPADYAGLIISEGHQVADPPAATVLDHVPSLPAGAIVTGTSPGPDIVSAAVDSALRFAQHIPASQALLWKLAGDKPEPLVLKPGETRAAQLEYTAGAAPAATTDLTVQNRGLATPRETLTLFSNSPENVYKAQLLYEAELPAGRAARLVYHHQSQSRAPLRFYVRVLSTGPGSALHVIPGTASTDMNTFYIGFRSAENYWNNLNAGNGYIAPLAAGGQAVLLAQELAYGYTASGYMKLTNLGEAPLRVEVLCLPSGVRLPDSAVEPGAATTHSVFDAPYLSESDVYTAGDPWLYLRLGEGRPESSTDDSILHGCYGMTHSYSVELHNPSDQPTLVFVLLRASAGEVKGQFFIDDKYIATPLVAGGEERLLQEVPLPPGQTKLLSIKAIALNGGFYPASIVVRETRYP